MFLLTKQLLIIFKCLIVMMKNTVWSQLFGIVFIDARKYNVMYKTLSGSHSFLPWVVIHKKEMFFLYYGQPTTMLYLTFSYI